MAAGHKGVFGKGKSSSTTPGISPLDQIGRLQSHPAWSYPFTSWLEVQPIFRGKCESETNLEQSSAPIIRTVASNEFTSSGHPQCKYTMEITQNAAPRAEKTRGALENHSTTWGIELENGALPSDSSSISLNTIVIDTRWSWNKEGAQQLMHPALDSPDGPRSTASQSVNEPSHSPLRVTSKFFPNRVVGSGLRDVNFPWTPAVDREDHPHREPGTPALDDFYG
jgi:hypothetical protein